jgi:putative PIN family toxin of toxin-antitoxin system
VIRAVLDANVLVSASLVSSGPSACLLRQWEEGTFALCVADTILAEVQDVLRRPHIARRYAVTDLEVEAFVNMLREKAVVVQVTQPPEIISADPKDNHVLACAVQTGADVIVTGDRHLLNLERYRDILLLTPAAFLADLLQRPPDDAFLQERKADAVPPAMEGEPGI